MKNRFELKKCIMFCTTNDTNQWALCVDDYVGLFETEAGVNDALQPTAGEHWDDSGFGCMQIIPPYTTAKKWDDNNQAVDNSRCLISHVQPIDMANYIKLSSDRNYAQFLRDKTTTLKSRYIDYLVKKADLPAGILALFDPVYDDIQDKADQLFNKLGGQS